MALPPAPDAATTAVTTAATGTTTQALPPGITTTTATGVVPPVRVETVKIESYTDGRDGIYKEQSISINTFLRKIPLERFSTASR